MVMLTKEETISTIAMVSKGGQKLLQQPSLQVMTNKKPNILMKTKMEADEGGGYTHCGNMKHTRETCFKLNGYPNWWHELKAKKKLESGRIALASA